MADVMLSPQATWVVPTTNSDPANSPQQNQVPLTKRPHSPSDMRQNRAQKSASTEIGPVMDHSHLDESGCDNPDGILLRESDSDEAATLMHLGEIENTETDQDDAKQTEPTNDSPHVNELIKQFESFKAHNNGEEKGDSFSATQVHQAQEESVLGKIIDGFGIVVKEVEHIVEGLEMVFAHTTRCVLLEFQPGMDQGTDSNIHIQHPSYTGNMFTLGMNVDKVERGHLVQTVTPGGLAYKANIKDDDIIRKVNDIDVGDWEFEKLQQFFGNEQSIEFKLLIERQNGVDENGQSLFVTLTVTIKMSVEDDRVIAEVDVTYKSWPLAYYGPKPSKLPAYFIFQEGPKTSKYLSLDNGFCGMTTDVTENCCFQMYKYKPSVSSPRILYNKAMSRPLDLGKQSRIGDDNVELTGSGISTASDKRFFYNRKQLKTNLYVFELIARPNYFLTVANDDTITETHFQGVDSVTDAGLFNTVLAPSSFKSDPSKEKQFLRN